MTRPLRVCWFGTWREEYSRNRIMIEGLRRNGVEEPITGFAHHESIFGAAEYPAETMDMAYGQDVMRLHLA